MKRLYIGAMTMLGLWACQGDPTASLRGSATRMTIQPGLIFISEGDERTVEVTVHDAQLNPLATSVEASSSNTGVFTVRSDSVPPTNNAESRFFISALAPGQAMLNLAGAGVTDAATVNVLPLAFTGAASTTTPQVGQVFTLSSTPLLEFGANTDIDFGDGITGTITDRTATSLTVRVPQPDAPQPGPLTLTDVVVNYVPGLEATLPTAVAFEVQNPFEPNSSPDPVYSFSVPVSGGAATEIYDGFKSSEADNFYSFTLAAPTTLTFLLEWDTAADIDLLVCSAPCAALADFLGGANAFDGASAAQPETATMSLPAGTHNLYVNAFDNHDEPAHLYKITVTQP